MDSETLATPVVIQGGMGVAVSGWRLARAVGSAGQLGVVSGTALDVVHARSLGDGDPDGHLRRAYAAFPDQGIVERVLARWFVAGGKAADEPYRRVPRPVLDPPRIATELTVLANFAEVWLAKEGHHGPIGVNYLEKIQLPTPAAAYGAVLAGVDAVLMGAGIPAAVPQLLTDLSAGRPVDYRISVDGAGPDQTVVVHFDPSDLLGGRAPVLRRPKFFAIVSSHTLAAFLARDPLTRPDGFVVETSIAGGHNAPPRGRLQLDDRGQPVYGPRDRADPAQLIRLGLPFWMAGGFGNPEGLREALASGAAGVQVGTAFALCEESGLDERLRDEVVRRSVAGTLTIRTDPLASPSGFPFKVAELPGTTADLDVRDGRERVCDLGYLRTPYRRDDGSVGYRCASEPVRAYVRKGGRNEDTQGRACLCNSLVASAGFGQRRPRGETEAPLVTMGDDVTRVVQALADPDAGRWSWTASDVLAFVLGAS